MSQWEALLNRMDRWVATVPGIGELVAQKRELEQILAQIRAETPERLREAFDSVLEQLDQMIAAALGRGESGLRPAMAGGGELPGGEMSRVEMRGPRQGSGSRPPVEGSAPGTQADGVPPEAVAKWSRSANWNDVQSYIGKPAGDLPPGYHYRKREDGRIEVVRRVQDNQQMVPLQIGDDGTLQATTVVSNRISNPRLMGENFAKAFGGKIAEGYQIHHLIPDEVVRTHPLAKFAREHAGYDLDRGTNLLGMAGKEQWELIQFGDATPVTGAGYTNTMGHWSSHRDYTNEVRAELDERLRRIESHFGVQDLNGVSAERQDELEKMIQNEMRNIENRFRRLIAQGQVNTKDGRIAWQQQETTAA